MWATVSISGSRAGPKPYTILLRRDMGLYDSPIRPSTQTLCLLGLRWNEPEALNHKPLNMLYHMSFKP